MLLKASCMFIVGLFLPAVGRAQIVEEYRVKAAFVYNFPNFIEWPARNFKSAQGPLIICALGKSPLSDALAEVVQQKPAEGRPIVIRVIEDAVEASECHIIFIRASERKRSRSILDVTSGRGILTVGEMDSFLAEGGVINFKIDNEKIRIQVNLRAADQQQLRISSKLLGLSQIVVGR